MSYGYAGAYCAFKSGRIRALDVVSTGEDISREFRIGALQARCAGEGGSFVDDGLHCLQLRQIKLLAALGDDGLFDFLGAALACADDEGEEALLACELTAVEDELGGLAGAAFERHHGLGQASALRSRIYGGDGFVLQGLGGLGPLRVARSLR